MKTLTLQQGSESWLAHRRTTRNASEAPAMMGVSPYVSRAELIRQHATGIDREIDEATQRVFDRGHAVEPALRARAERILSEDLYPVTGVSDDGYLGASFDGVTLAEDVILEAKQPNASKQHQIDIDVIPEVDYWQIVQQFAVCETAQRCLYLVGDGSEDTAVLDIKRERIAHDIPNLIAGWRQFDADVAAYVPEPAKAEVVAAPVAGFGALSLRVEGRVLASNLDAFKADAESFIARLPKPADLQSDQDFADAESAAKACSEAESRIKAAREAALAQMADVDSLLRTAESISEAIRSARLALEKAVKAEKENRRAEIVAAGREAVRAHVAVINATLGEHALGVPASVTADLATAIKGKKSLASMRDAVDAAVAQHKIEASQTAERVRANIALLAEAAGEHLALFADRVTLCATKAPEDLRNLIAARIAEHQRSQEARLEAERARIRAEEEAKARAEQEKSKAEEARAAAEAKPVQAPISPAIPMAAGAAPTPAGARLKLGDINAMIAPLSITAEGLAQIGFPSVGTDRAAKLYNSEDLPKMLQCLSNRLSAAIRQQVAA